MDPTSPRLDEEGLRGFLRLREQTVEAVAGRFDAELPHLYASFGERGREACREDIEFNIDFLRPALEFGLLQPFLEYVRWLRDVLEARGIPAEHVSLSLQWMEDFYRERLPPTSADSIGHALASARNALAAPGAALEGIERHMPKAWQQADALAQALLAGDHRAAAGIMRRSLERGTSLLEAEIHLLQPALYRVGRRWQANEVSVAQEHLATATATTILAQLAAEVEPESSTGTKVLLGCVAGNEHAVGLRMVADGLEQAGWEVRYLGANVPTRSLVEHVAHWSPALVGLSVSMPYHLRAAREVIAALRGCPGGTCPAVMIGGLAINGFPALTHELGAKGTAADAVAALEMAKNLLGGSV